MTLTLGEPVTFSCECGRVTIQQIGGTGTVKVTNFRCPSCPQKRPLLTLVKGGSE